MNEINDYKHKWESLNGLKIIIKTLPKNNIK
jgi:hypothetical protein